MNSATHFRSLCSAYSSFYFQMGISISRVKIVGIATGKMAVLFQGVGGLCSTPPPQPGLEKTRPHFQPAPPCRPGGRSQSLGEFGQRLREAPTRIPRESPPRAVGPGAVLSERARLGFPSSTVGGRRGGCRRRRSCHVLPPPQEAVGLVVVGRSVGRPGWFKKIERVLAS